MGRRGIVYCAIFPSGKKYYGITSLRLSSRKAKHKSCFLRGDKNYFYNAIRKYGWENIEWVVKEEYFSDSSISLSEILYDREKYWIQKDKTHIKEYGYNMTSGGDGVIGLRWTDESKEKLSNSQKGRSLTQSHRNNIGRGLLGRKVSEETKNKIGEKNRGNKYCVGVIRSKETREKMSVSKRSHNNPMYGKSPANKGIRMSPEQKERRRISMEKRKLDLLK